MFEINAVLIQRIKSKYDKPVTIIWLILICILLFLVGPGHNGHLPIVMEINNPVLNIFCIGLFIAIIILKIFPKDKIENIGKLVLKENTITVISDSQNLDYKLSNISSLKLTKKSKLEYLINFDYKSNPVQLSFRVDQQAPVRIVTLKEMVDIWQTSHPNAF
jgi:hypothetical protein